MGSLSAPVYSGVNDVPLAVAVFLANDDYDYDPDPFAISATTLLKSTRQIILGSRIGENGDPVPLINMIKSRMGSAIHASIERSWVENYKRSLNVLGIPGKVIDRVAVNPSASDVGPDAIPIYLEQRHSRKVGKWTVSGKFDFVGEGMVQDFKSTSTFTYKNQTKVEDYRKQGSIYRWLASDIITADKMQIHYIFTDWKANQARIQKDYPSKPVLSQDIELMSISATEQFVKNKLAELEQYWDAPEEELPDCNDYELWRSEPVFKYYKNGDVNAPRSTKNFDTRQEAMIYMASHGNVGAIKEVPGQAMACKYCPAFAICTQKDRLIASGDLTID